MGDRVNKYVLLEHFKKKFDPVYKQAKADAEDELAEVYEATNSRSIVSSIGDIEVGKVEYAEKRKKHVVDFNLADGDEFHAWCVDNVDAVAWFAAKNAVEFGKEWLEETGELPDGISRVEYDIPARKGDPKVRLMNADMVEKAISGNIVEGVNRLLLGDGE